ncbi:protein FAM153A isoform X3 [Macaca fascicularis]
MEEHLREKKKEAPWKVKEAWREQESGRVAQQQLGSCSHPPPPHTPALCARHPRLPEVLQQLPWLTVTLCFLVTVASEMFPEMTLALCQRVPSRMK